MNADSIQIEDGGKGNCQCMVAKVQVLILLPYVVGHFPDMVFR